MDPDSYQKAWHSQSSQARVTIAADLLLKEVQRSQRNFRAMTFYRDFREGVVGFFMLPLWFFLGYWLYLPWTWYLAVPAITWVILFILVDRIRHKQQPSEPGEPLLDCVKVSLIQVEHQIWLRRNVFWWSLLPFTIAILAFLAQFAWLNHSGFWAIILTLVPYVAFLLVLYGFVYYLSQRAIRRELEPRRQELLSLLVTLGDEATVEQEPAVNLARITRPGALWQSLFVTVLCAVLVIPMFLVARVLAPRIGRPYISNRGTPAPFAHLNSDLRREKRLVGLAAMVTVDGKVVASAVDGERKTGSGEPLEIDDQWHLGGITTSITATMIGRLIEKGQLEWSTTVGECFPDAPMHKHWKSVTFQELLTHTSGAPPIFGPDVSREQMPPGSGLTLARRDAVLRVLAKKPDDPPGKKYAYSNVGSTIAAAMAEKKTGATWEDLVKREVFEPLALTSAGFGPPKSPDETLPQPRGHRLYLGAKFAASDEIDNSPIMGPAGSVRMSLSDLSTYGTEHLRGQLGKGKLLSAETYQRLHAPRLNQYAYGWGLKDGGAKTPYTIYWHNGSNTLWYALVVFIPEKNMVVAVTANDGDFEKAEAAAWEIVQASVNQFSAEVDPARREPLQKADYPKRAPFAGVRWEGDKPVVKIGEEWLTLVSLDGIAAGDIVAFSRRTYADKWQKRFEEDLVEVLTRMGHEPKDIVRLVVSPLGSPATRTIENIPMTEANRRAIYDAASARERGEQQPETQGAAPAKGAKVPLTDLIPRLRKEKSLVGVAAMVMVDGEVLESAVDGERKNGSGVRLAIDDRWHLGSITKSITATMIARLVESGQLKFSDTIGKCFPDAGIHAAWKPVTLKQLLTHTAGAPANFSLGVKRKRPPLGPECTLARREAIVKLLAEKPENPPGEKFAYSNVGYTIAGAMAEMATDATWDDLVKREVFEPLKLTGAGFGPPKSPAEMFPQPRGHRPLLGWKTAMDDDADNTAIIGPAGIVHMTLEDLCTYATEHLRGDLGAGKLLSAETYKLLHTPKLHRYACGWVRKEPCADIPHTVYWHNGSNTMWYALVVFIPEKKMVVAVTSNDGDVEKAEAAAWEIVKTSVNPIKVEADLAGTEQQQGMRPAVPIKDVELFRTRIAEFLSTARIKAGFNGAVVVARGGQPVYQGAFGFSHLESKAPNSLDTPFRIASLSKQFTAAAIFRLESQGKLSIDDPVHRHLPEFSKSPYRGITIHHLLTHTSGLPRTPQGILGSLRWNAMSRAATPADDYVRLAVQMHLNFEPGADYEYSNFGYRVLAALIARVTGRDYADFMEQDVFRPLGMNDTGVARVTRPPSEARIAEGLTFLKLDRAGQPLFGNGEEGRNYGTGYGSGGIYTSANDLLRWDRVLAGDEFLAESEKTRLFQPIHGNYACGWVVKKSGLDGRLYQMHSGANEGFFSQMMRLPEDDLVIIAVGNVDDTPVLEEVLDQLFRLCRSLPYRDP